MQTVSLIEFRITLCLNVPQFKVLSVFVLNQFLMGALLDDSSLMEYGDLVAEFARG